ncbi:MAG: phenylalanine--tRNA ligase subunit beta [Phycisphaerales bacterium]|nr:MAG: phenylalanine--tRNA ligase subunit beta [Phycisphaerales bacterium]
MLISTNWLRDFLDFPADIDPHALAERFTCTTAEVEGVERIDVAASGLIAAQVETLTPLAGGGASPGADRPLLVGLNTGAGGTIETVTIAPNLSLGCRVIYAPPGASITARPRIDVAAVAGRQSTGMILPGEELGIAMAEQEAILLPASVPPGQRLDEFFRPDWVIEIDNKSITHRPDLWGHYGIAREMAAIFGVPLRPCPMADVASFDDPSKPALPISIEDARACPRYSGLRFENVGAEPAPPWVQLRLGHVGLRPIYGLVDLTNYIMLELGQPMHAFDGTHVDRIEVAWSKPGETFRTLDGVERTLPACGGLMIQCGGRSIAIAGIMGGLDTEVGPQTRSLLLESANFDGAAIRRCAAALGLRTDASARFEKSLDPENTVRAIRRFVTLARQMFPDMALTSRLSDCFPRPPAPVTVAVHPRHVARTVGRAVPVDEVRRILEPLEFSVREDGERLAVHVPGFRATRDVSIEADVIEEIARFVGFDTITPVMPPVTMRRFEPNGLHEFEQRTLEAFSTRSGFHEVHGYIWYDLARLQRVGIDPGECVELRHSVAGGQRLLRRRLMPGLLDAISLNRFHWAEFKLMELGSVFEPGDGADSEFRHLALISARRQKRGEDELFRDLKGDIEAWACTQMARGVRFAECAAGVRQPWEEETRIASVIIDDRAVGQVSALPLALRRGLDEHLAAWSVVWAELRLNELASLPAVTEELGRIPAYPIVEMDYSFVVPATVRFARVEAQLTSFCHPLLKRLTFVDAYEGRSVGDGLRSLTIRAYLGREERTLVDADSDAFRRAFESQLTQWGYKIRA